MSTAKQKSARRPARKTTKKASVNRSAANKPASSAAMAKQLPSVSEERQAETGKKTGRASLPTAWSIARKSLATLSSRPRLFIGIAVIYILFGVLLVRGLSGGSLDISTLKDLISGNFTGGFSQLWTSVSLFTILLTASGTTVTGLEAAYQVILLLTVSLAIIWALRQVMAGHTHIRIRDSFYKGMYPVIPVVLILLVVMIQLLPFIFGAYIYGLIISNGVAVHVIEKILWGIVLLAGTAASLYLLSSSVFAVYVATLPDMTPVKALRAARDLVRYRRWAVLRKLLFLPLALFIAGVIIMSPILLYVTGLSPFIFFVLSMISVVLIHAYMYTLYRELLA